MQPRDSRARGREVFAPPSQRKPLNFLAGAHTPVSSSLQGALVNTRKGKLMQPAKRRRPTAQVQDKRAERPQGMQTMGPELYLQICQAVRELSPAVRNA